MKLTMKTFSFSSLKRFLVILGLASVMSDVALTAQSGKPLEAVAQEAMNKGKDGSINAGFAGVLGLSTNRAVPIKQLKESEGGVTNRFSIIVADRTTIVLATRSNYLSTYFLTDVSGKLKRVIVNDGSIASGGLTNIPVARAEPQFQKLKGWWIKRISR